MNVEHMELQNGQKVKFERHPRYGLWAVHFQRGDVPAILKGHWSSLPELKTKTEHYLANREKNKTAPRKDNGAEPRNGS